LRKRGEEIPEEKRLRKRRYCRTEKDKCRQIDEEI